MCKLLVAFIGLASVGLASDAASKLPYSQNVVQLVTFDPQGEWTITGVAAHSDTPSLSRITQRRLVGTVLSIRGSRVELRSGRFFSDKQSFPTTIIGQETYDTHSREFWLDFRTDASALNLPRTVNATDVEFGTLLATADGRVFLDLGGVWFTLQSSNRRNGPTL